MQHPTAQAEHIDVLTRALAIAAKHAAKGDAAVACGLMDLWILMASAEYVAALNARLKDQPCGHC